MKKIPFKWKCWMKLHAIGIELKFELKKDGIQIITKKYWKFVYTYDVEKKEEAVKNTHPKRMPFHPSFN